MDIERLKTEEAEAIKWREQCQKAEEAKEQAAAVKEQADIDKKNRESKKTL